MTVVTMIHATTVRVWYGCKVYGLTKSGVTPGGGAKPGFIEEAIQRRDRISSRLGVEWKEKKKQLNK